MYYLFLMFIHFIIMKFFKKLIISAGIIIGSFVVAVTTFAAGTNIAGSDPSFVPGPGSINMHPSSGGVEVREHDVIGYAWGNTIGWINFGPLQNAGVTNVCNADKSMKLGGHAWGQNTGWINFAPKNGGVSISANGNFSGHAWSQNHGWIDFSGVTTTFRCPTSEGGSIDLCTNISGVQSSVPEGYVKDPSGAGTPGVCTLIPNQAQDFCPNIAGVQNVVPTGYYVDTKGDCQIDYCPDLPGNQTSIALCPGQVVDLCPNIAGNQKTIPAGYVVNNLGQCVLAPVVDVCPNISGNQASLPFGYVYDASGNCVADLVIPEPENPNPNTNPPDNDVCLNLVGNQSSVPNGFITDGNGNCLSPDPTDLCPNMVGEQTYVPTGYMINESGNCVEYVPHDECPNISGNQPVGTDCNVVNPIDTPPGNKKLGGGTTKVLSDFLDGLFDLNKIATPLVTGITIVGLASTIPGFLTRIGNLLLSLPFRRKRRPWGIVYDSETKEPLDPAHVVIYNTETNEVVDTKITDIHGRYGFLLSSGMYRMVVQKTNYEFPSRKLPQSHSDGVYDDLYFGEVFTIANDEKDSVVVFNIPMDKVADDWNQQEKKRMGITDWFTRNSKLWSTISMIIFVLGFLFSVYALIVAPNVWNKVIFVLYIVFGLLQLFGFKGVTTGTITDRSGRGIPFAVVRVWNTNLKTQIAQRITNDQGQYYILVAKGDYYITIDVKNASGGYDRVLTSNSMKVKNGTINQSFII